MLNSLEAEKKRFDLGPKDNGDHLDSFASSVFEMVAYQNGLEPEEFLFNEDRISIILESICDAYGFTYAYMDKEEYFQECLIRNHRHASTAFTCFDTNTVFISEIDKEEPLNFAMGAEAHRVIFHKESLLSHDLVFGDELLRSSIATASKYFARYLLLPNPYFENYINKIFDWNKFNSSVVRGEEYRAINMLDNFVIEKARRDLKVSTWPIKFRLEKMKKVTRKNILYGTHMY